MPDPKQENSKATVGVRGGRAMIDAYERRVFLAMVEVDERVAPITGCPSFGRNIWRTLLRRRRFAVSRLAATCHCGHTCPGPFMELHDCQGRGVR